MGEQNHAEDVRSTFAIRDGEKNGFSSELMVKKLLFPSKGAYNTILIVTAYTNVEQALYLWEDGNVLLVMLVRMRRLVLMYRRKNESI